VLAVTSNALSCCGTDPTGCLSRQRQSRARPRAAASDSGRLTSSSCPFHLRTKGPLKLLLPYVVCRRLSRILAPRLAPAARSSTPFEHLNV
jgi:hypothetical protein